MIYFNFVNIRNFVYFVLGFFWVRSYWDNCSFNLRNESAVYWIGWSKIVALSGKGPPWGQHLRVHVDVALNRGIAALRHPADDTCPSLFIHNYINRSGTNYTRFIVFLVNEYILLILRYTTQNKSLFKSDNILKDT